MCIQALLSGVLIMLRSVLDKMNKYMQIALDEAFSGMRKNHGGPFGAVITIKNKLIAKSHNQVIKSNDPTAHAEILAIRIASRKLRRFDLSDCEIYSTCEPCPMCLGAIHWAKIKKLIYSCTRKDAANIGFDDKFIYDAIKGTSKKIQVRKKLLDRNLCIKAFKEWQNKEDKVSY